MLKQKSKTDKKNQEYKPFPSANILLEIAIDEYHRELERTSFLLNKASVFIAAITTILTIFIPVIPFNKLLKALEITNKREAINLVIIICILLLSITIEAYSFYCFLKAYKLKDFSRVNLDNLDDDSLLKAMEELTEEAMIRHYKEIILRNVEINDTIAKQISRGLQMTIIGFFTLLMSSVLLNTFIGCIL